VRENVVPRALSDINVPIEQTHKLKILNEFEDERRRNFGPTCFTPPSSKSPLSHRSLEQLKCNMILDITYYRLYSVTLIPDSSAKISIASKYDPHFPPARPHPIK
jgi:hypothetical protein